MSDLNITTMSVIVGDPANIRSYKIKPMFGLTFFAGVHNRIAYVTVYPDEVRISLDKPYDEVHQDSSGGIWFTNPPIGGSTKLVATEDEVQLHDQKAKAV